jgi:precorrin-2 dehydrogenase/sirohydrochlorin ferrochelatase
MKNKETKFFPLFTDLTEKKAVVFGAGKIASRRVHTLLSFVGELHVIAPEASSEILAWAKEGRLTYWKKKYEREDLYDADLVLAATEDEKVNEDIYSACKCLGILVNTASDQKKCDFHFPAVIEQDSVVIGINGGGRDHRKVKEVRLEIEDILKSRRQSE